ncbi:MAG: glycosyltransferase family 4 protein [Planctomycetota bacterium]
MNNAMKAFDTAQMSEQSDNIRVAIQQPVLPAYRAPVFRALSERPGIDLKLYYGDRANSPSNVEAIGFEAEMVHLSERRLVKHPIIWHKPQWQCASKKTCDALILTWDLHYLSLVPGLVRARANGVRTILWGHGYSKNESALRSWPRNRVAALADALLFYNEPTAKHFIDSGWDPKRIYTASNTIDQNPIQEARNYWLDRPEDLNQFKQENKLDQGHVIIFVSRLDPENRLDLLIQSLPALCKQFAALQTIVIGKGDEERRRLSDIAELLGVSQSIRFLGPIYNEQELAPWMISADLFCYPANIGLSILHAFGYGLPVITSDKTSSQNPEIVSLQNYVNGLTYEDNKSDMLTQAISQVLGDAAFRSKLSQHAYKTATEVFSIKNMVDGMEAAIRGSVSPIP